MPLIAALFLGAVTLTKTEALISDPINGIVSPKAIPSAVVEYVVTVKNSSGAVVDSGALVITDPIPPTTKLYVGDLGGGAGPVATSQGLPLSGLSTVFTSLSSNADDVQFSADNGLSYAYTPQPDASGYDPAVTNLRVKTRGAGLIGGVYKVRFRVAVR